MKKRMAVECDNVQNKRMKVECDYLSLLPDDCMRKIHSFLDMSESIRFSLVQKKYRNFWKSLDVINIDSNLYPSNDELDRESARMGYEPRFIKYIFGVVQKRDQLLPIDTFRYTGGVVYFDCRELHIWLKFAGPIRNIYLSNIPYLRPKTFDQLVTTVQEMELDWVAIELQEVLLEPMTEQPIMLPFVGIDRLFVSEISNYLFLSLRDFQRVIPSAFEALADCFPNLKYLKITNLRTTVSIHVLPLLLQMYPCIEELYLQMFEEVEEEEGIEVDWGEQLARHDCSFSALKKVEFLNIEGCPNELMLINFFVQNSPNLEKLGIPRSAMGLSEDEFVIFYQNFLSIVDVDDWEERD